jgi:hypothetical protein
MGRVYCEPGSFAKAKDKDRLLARFQVAHLNSGF